MSQFDQTTETNAEKYPKRYFYSESVNTEVRADFTAGRNSAKESLEILARFAEKMLAHGKGDGVGFAAMDAIAAVKARGDWPLEEDISHKQSGAQ